MKRILFTILIAFFVGACATAQTRHTKGVKIDNAPEVTSVPANGMLLLTDSDNENLVYGISLANLVSQLNLTTENLTTEEVQDILGSALTSGIHSGGTFVYDDVLGTVSLTVPSTADGNDFPISASLTGNILTISSSNQADVTVDLSSLQGGSGVADGDYGDIRVTASGTGWSIDENTVSDNEIIDNSIGPLDYQDLSVTGTKIADNAVGVDKLNDSLTGPPTSGQVLSVNASNELNWVDQIAGGVDTDDQTAEEVSLTPIGEITATDAQAAIQQLEDRKMDRAGSNEAIFWKHGNRLTEGDNVEITLDGANGFVRLQGGKDGINPAISITSQGVTIQNQDFISGSAILTRTYAEANFSETDDQSAVEVAFDDAGLSIIAPDVQTAIEQLDAKTESNNDLLTFDELFDGYVYQASDFTTGRLQKTYSGEGEMTATIPAGVMPIGAKGGIKIEKANATVNIVYGAGQEGIPFTVIDSVSPVTIVHWDYGGGNTRIEPTGNWVPYNPSVELYTVGNWFSTIAYETDSSTGLIPINSTIAKEETIVTSGLYAVKVTNPVTGNSSRMEIDMVLEDNTDYVIKFTVSKEDGGSFRVGSWIGFTASIPSAMPSTTTVDTSPKELTLNVTTDASGATRKMRFYNDGAAIDGTSFYIENFSIKKL